MDDLFDEALIGELTDPGRVVERREPLGQITEALDDPDCRIVLLTGGAGTGKTGVLAALGRDHPDWPRYFIRRAAERETAYQHEGGLASVLTVVGLQLSALRGELFPKPAVVEETVCVREAAPGTSLTGIAIPRVIISPFTDLNVRFLLKGGRVSGEMTGVTIGEIVEAAYADPPALEGPALRQPALALAREHPGDRIVILIDGVDELRLRDTSVDVLTWLTDHPEFPGNIRFVVTSRPDPRLAALLTAGRADVRTVTLDDSADASRFAELIADGPAVSEVLTSRRIPRDTFVQYASRRAGGNFRYLALLRGMIEDAADLDWLAAGEDRWPAGLNALYRDYLLRTRDRVGRTTRTRAAWEQVYRPVLGMLTVAEASLTAAQIAAFGSIPAVATENCATALARLGQLLRRAGDAYRFDHASLADFLLDETTEASLRTDAAHWHTAITDYAFSRHAPSGTWQDADPYLLVSLPAHAEADGRLDDLIEDPRFLIAADKGDRGILSRLAAADRARPVARLLRQVLPMLRRRDPGALAHLHLYARQAHLDAFAGKVAELITSSPWTLGYTQWQPELVRGVIGQHDGEIRALAVTRDDDGRPVAVTGGDDRTIRVWDLTTGSQLSPLRDRLERADPRSAWALAAGAAEPGKPVVVSGDFYGCVRAWDLTTGSALGDPMEDFGNCGKAIAAGAIRGVAVVLCRTGSRLRLWDPDARAPLTPPFVTGPPSELADVATLLEDGQDVLAAVRLNDDGGWTGEHVRVWDVLAGKPRGFPLRPAEGYPTAVAVAVAVASPGNSYAVVLADVAGGIQAFDLDTGEPRFDRVLAGRPVTALAAGRVSGQLVIAGGNEKGELRIWDAVTGQPVSSPHLIPELDGGITAIGIVPSWDGGRLILAGRNRVPPATEKERAGAERAQQLLLAMFGERAQDTALSTEPRMLTFTPPGQRGTRPVRFQHPPADLTSVTVADAADHRVIVGTDGYRAYRWNLATGQREAGTWCGPADRVRALAVTSLATSRPCAVSGIGTTVCTWDIREGRQLREPRSVGRDHEEISGLAITRRNGGPVALCATWRSGAYLLDLAGQDGPERLTQTEYLSSAAAGELGGKAVAAFGNGSRGVTLLDVATGEPVTPPHPATGAQVTSVAIASRPGQSLVVSGALDRTLRVWDPADPDAIHVTQVDADVTQLAVTELDGYPVAVCGGPSGEVRVVDLLPHAAAGDDIGQVTAVAVSGDLLLCGTGQGIRVYGLHTGEPRQARVPALRRVGVLVSGTYRDRPIALAAELYGREAEVWYTDTGDPVATVRCPAGTIESAVLGIDRGQTLVILGTFDQQVVITDLDGDTTLIDGYRERITDIAMIHARNVPVIVTSGAGVTHTRYLHEHDRPPWPDGDGTPPQPLIFEDRVLPDAGTGWAMTTGTVDGQPFVASGKESGAVVLHTLTGVPLAGSPLDGGADKITALAFGQFAGHPVLASGALDGTVRVWDLNDIRAPVTIATLAGVSTIALAEPDLCVIGTRKGLLAVRLDFVQDSGGPVPVRSPHDIRADQVCPSHATHEHPSGLPGGPRVPTVCVKGVQLVLNPWGKRRPPLTMPNGHCYLADGRLVVVSGGEQLSYPLAEITANGYDEPLGHWHDGCHFGIGIRTPHRTFAIACYRRGERNRLLQAILANGGSQYGE